MQFTNRREGGRKLAEKLDEYSGRNDVVVLGLARGGLPVADELAKALRAPLDVFLVQKIGVPGREELAMGAITSGGARVLNEDIVSRLNISEEDIESVEKKEQEEIRRREKEYRGTGAKGLELKNKTVIIVDDGLATGASMRAAVKGVREMSPKELIVAVPAAARDAEASLAETTDKVITVISPDMFMSVGSWYKDFDQTTDTEVKEILSQAKNSGGNNNE